MKGAQIIGTVCKELQISKVFYYPGGTISPLLHALINEKIECICTKNEQGAGYAAIGAAKVTSMPQVVMVTSGPGATNVLTCVADAYFDSVPLIVFTGQVAVKDINYDNKIRQTGFQEINTIKIFEPVTKGAFLLDKSKDIRETVTKAYHLAISGRPGPVVIDLPMDIQLSEVESDAKSELHYSKTPHNNHKLDYNIIDSFKSLLEGSDRPLIFAGNGIYISNAVAELRKFAHKLAIPVLSSLPGMGIFPTNDDLFFGFPGHTGEFVANLAMYNSDLIIGLGVRFDLRQTGTEIHSFKKNKKIVRVDIDSRELEYGRVSSDLTICADLKEVLLQWTDEDYGLIKARSLWKSRLKEWRKLYRSSQFYQSDVLFSYDIIRAVDIKTKTENVVVSSGVGGHQQMVARYFNFNYPERRWLTSAGHGTMGFDIPACIGAVNELKNTHIGIVFVGDGSFQMNMQELAVIRELNLPIKIFILDNQKLGIVSQFQKLMWNSDPGTGDKKNPHFSKLGDVYDIDAYIIHSKKDIPGIMNQVFSSWNPALIHCFLSQEEETLPMLMGGKALNEMTPFGLVCKN